MRVEDLLEHQEIHGRVCGRRYDKLEFDREDVHDRKKWRQNVMKRKSNTIGNALLSVNSTGYH